MDHPPTLVLVTGIPGTGKSTMAEAAAAELGAPVLAWDWVMAGLTPFPAVQTAIDALDGTEHARVGWSMLFNLATTQLRHGRSVVLDGVARDPQIRAARDLALAHGAGCVVALTRCADPDLHRRRVEGRQRDIPGWYELEWADVLRSRQRWSEPDPIGIDITLDAGAPLEVNHAALIADLIAARSRG